MADRLSYAWRYVHCLVGNNLSEFQTLSEDVVTGQKLVRETLSLAGTPCVETTAVMAKYNPFFERAGMTKIQETPPRKQAIAVRETLAKLGFNTTLMGSQS